ncbi:5153_t:CDS:1 [Diversispora eburnea]|uniref:5153_t:CDS:1 n=1 Tax=Diversispora eburnea TaxID=1213867 RepID=A0A9N9CMU1_9GLOM|nr:5153_t:CDS:1 [Diversispora eburnea]
MSVNSLPTRIQNDEIVPIPLERESYFYRHSTVKFTFELKNVDNIIIKHSACGMLFLSDKRLMFISDDLNEKFQTFHIKLADIVSSVRSASINFFRNNNNVFSVTNKLRNGAVVNMAIEYDPEDQEDKRIFEDYYGMLITWTSKIPPVTAKNKYFSFKKQTPDQFEQYEPPPPPYST